MSGQIWQPYDFMLHPPQSADSCFEESLVVRYHPPWVYYIYRVVGIKTCSRRVEYRECVLSRVSQTAKLLTAAQEHHQHPFVVDPWQPADIPVSCLSSRQLNVGLETWFVKRGFTNAKSRSWGLILISTTDKQTTALSAPMHVFGCPGACCLLAEKSALP